MKCMNEDCTVELTGRQKTYCSDKCRMGYKRANKRLQDRVQSTIVAEPEQVESEQAKPERPYQLKPEHTVYNRQAVSYKVDKFETKPEPLDVTDTPHAGGRGRYTRLDGTVYQFDCRGHSFECKHLFKDKNGVEHLAIYKDADEVRACYEPAQAAPVDEVEVKAYV